MRKLSQWIAIWCGLIWCGCWTSPKIAWSQSSSAEAGTSAAVDYLRDIKPLLSQHCYACHGALKQAGGLRLDTAAAMRSGGDSGAAVNPGQASQSLLLERVNSSDPDTRMPPEGKPLAAAEIQRLSDWISAGAPGPQDEQPQADPLQHWAFQPPQAQLPQTPIAQVDAQALAHPIDAWLAVKASSFGVVPLGPASRRELVRRVTLDLIGLPPTRQEIMAFETNQSPDAYEKLVDSLLARPEYGERWGRHWMDVWRYSDWYGRRAVPDVMNSYPQIWRWRDWIVRSLNEDKGYDRMLMEMVAADELCPTDDQNIVATGFIVRNWYKWNYETWMKDCVEHTGKAFLGLTLNCAHCHDHKFDPITQEDYFRFRAFFEPLELRHERVAGEPDPGPFKKYVYAQSYGPIKSGAIRIFDEKLDAQTFMFRGGDARNRIEGKPPVDCGPPRALTPDGFAIERLQLPPEAAYPGLKESIRTDERRAAQTEVDQATNVLSQAEAKHQQNRQAMLALKSSATGPATANNLPAEGELIKADMALSDSAMAVRLARNALDVAIAKQDALEKRITADDAAQSKSTRAEELARLAHRAENTANHLTAEQARQVLEWDLVTSQRAVADAQASQSPKLEELKKSAEATSKKLDAARTAAEAARDKLANTSTEYTPLSPKYPAQSTGRRTALAKWLVDARNPLTARVAVNHMWLRHFGTPLVESVDNFGLQGKPPVHPELLDWLAVRLMQDGWSMKALHRLIVTSQAYRRSSTTGAVDHPGYQQDRDNISYWHFPVRRMEAEVVRDSVIACAGVLDRTVGGPEIEVTNWVARPRRSLYFTLHGESQMQFLSTFDGANPCECYRRSSTVLPAQALALANSELLVHYGRVCAAHLQKQLDGQIVDISSNLVDTSSKKVDTSTNSAFVLLAFETLLGRLPTEQELTASLEFLEQMAGEVTSVKEAATDDKSKPVIQAPAGDPVLRAKENLVMALFNHNDFVTIR